MLQRSELLFKVLCYAAGAVCLFQVSHLALRRDALANVRIPGLPTLTNAPAVGAPPSNPDTGVLAKAKGLPGISTNSAVTNTGTNIPNVVTTNTANAKASPANTNLTVPLVVNSTGATVASAEGTNLVKTPVTNTSAKMSGATNTRPVSGTAMKGGMPPGMARPGMGPELPADIKVKVERVIDSEILGPVMRPMPMALLGIAGENVFLRASNGQSGLVKEGDTLGGVKILKVGVNRVLVEEDGQSKELMIFMGMGGETLVSNIKTNL